MEPVRHLPSRPEPGSPGAAAAPGLPESLPGVVAGPPGPRPGVVAGPADGPESEVELQARTDFQSAAVPASHRRSLLAITIVWTGFVFVITSMMAGGGLAAGLGFGQIVLATLLGNVFLSVVAIAVAVIASRTGLSFALITRYSFGRRGSRIATLFVPVVNVGWYSIQSAAYGHFIAMILGVAGTPTELAIMFASALVMGIFALIGMRALTILGYVAIPAIVFLSIAAAMKSAGAAGGVAAVLGSVPTAPISLLDGVTIVIGTWILSTATCIADIMRYARSTRDAVISAVIGLVGGNSLLILCGAIAAIGTRRSDLTEVLLGLGLVVPSLILMTTNIFTTNASNLYSTSLNLANSFDVDRRVLILVILLISGAATLTRPYDISSLFTFLNALGVIVPPLAGIILSDYFVVHRGRYPGLDSPLIREWSAAPWLTWAGAVALVQIVPVGQASVNGIVFGLLLYPLLDRVLRHVAGKES